MAYAKKPKEPPPLIIMNRDELLETISIMLAHRIYFTLSNPTHSNMNLHVPPYDVSRCQELFPAYFPKRVNTKADYGYSLKFKLSGAPDKATEQDLRLSI